MRQVPVQMLVCSLFTLVFASSTTHPLITATHLPFSPSLPPHCHSPLSSRLALTSQLASPSFRASAVSSHCLLSSSLSHRLSLLGHTYLPSPPSASCPPIVHLCLKKVHLLLPFHVNLSPLASALLAVSPRHNLAIFRYRIFIILQKSYDYLHFIHSESPATLYSAF
jgi:hypothetical protein